MRYFSAPTSRSSRRRNRRRAPACRTCCGRCATPPLRRLLLQRGGAGGVVERPGFRAGVEFQPIGGDAARPAREHDVAGRDHAVVSVKARPRRRRTSQSAQSISTCPIELDVVLAKPFDRPVEVEVWKLPRSWPRRGPPAASGRTRSAPEHDASTGNGTRTSRDRGHSCSRSQDISDRRTITISRSRDVTAGRAVQTDPPDTAIPRRRSSGRAPGQPERRRRRRLADRAIRRGAPRRPVGAPAARVRARVVTTSGRATRQQRLEHAADVLVAHGAEDDRQRPAATRGGRPPAPAPAGLCAPSTSTSRSSPACTTRVAPASARRPGPRDRRLAHRRMPLPRALRAPHRDDRVVDLVRPRSASVSGP